MGVTVIIPIHNLHNRGLIRVFNSCYSLLRQDDLEQIIIMNSSNPAEFSMLKDLLSNLNTDKILHLNCPLPEFNKPYLLNRGIDLAKSEWIMCTDADYIFKADFLEVCKGLRSAKKILFKEVKMMGRILVKRATIDRWIFPNYNYNEWGHLANGACQYATKDFFTANQYPETMLGFGAMDNIMAYIAYNKGLEICWIEESEILHQWHPIMKFRSKEDTAKFNENQRILEAYIKEHNLPKLLKKTR